MSEQPISIEAEYIPLGEHEGKSYCCCIQRGYDDAFYARAGGVDQRIRFGDLPEVVKARMLDEMDPTRN